MRKNGVDMKTGVAIESSQKDSEERVPGSTAQIRDTLKKVESEVTCIAPDKRFRKILKVLKKKDKEDIVQAVLEKFYNSDELKPYQAELIKMQRHLERTSKKMVILFDGRDASGKGGTSAA